MSSSEEYQTSSIKSTLLKYDIGITSYIERSPIATKFRLENPNLQPLQDDDSDTDMLTTTPEEISMDSSSKLYETEISSNFRNLTMSSESSMSLAGEKKKNVFRNSFSKFKSASNLSKKSLSNPKFTDLTNIRHPFSAQISDQTNSKQQSSFWKYHVLKFGNNLYLTTNPGLKHVYCRNGPGYYVEVVYNNPSNNFTKRNDGYKLIFEDIESIRSIKKENRQPIMIIEKKPENLGGHITVSSLRETELVDGNIGYTKKKPPVFDRALLPGIIDEKFAPFIRDMNLDLNTFKNYHFTDMNNIKWNVGPILRVRKSKLKKIKDKIINGITENQEEEENFSEQHLKLVNKKYIYFHRNYLKLDELQNCNNTFYRDTTGRAENIYNHDPNRQFPPVLAVFRPCEMKRTKRMSLSMSKNINHMKGKQSDSSKINKHSLEYDIGTGGDIKNYYTGGDGLYSKSHPIDDTPDDNKLGWISIYEDSRVFSGRKQVGMFDIVIGTTLAVGLETYLS